MRVIRNKIAKEAEADQNSTEVESIMVGSHRRETDEVCEAEMRTSIIDGMKVKFMNWPSR